MKTGPSKVLTALTASEALRTELRARVEESSAAQREAFEAAISALSRKLDERVNAAQERSLKRAEAVELSLTRFKYNMARDAESWSLALMYALWQLEQGSELDIDWYVEAALEGMSDCIDHGGKFNEDEMMKASELLKGVPDTYRHLADEVIRKLENARDPG